MITGMTTYTLIHVLFSLIGIGSGIVVLYGLLTSQQLPRWTHLFVWTTVGTTLTGFGFPFDGFTPAIGTGIVSTFLLVLLITALYGKKLSGGWRRIYVITAVSSLYLNVFVLIVQLFVKVPALNALAPQGNEPPFAIVQGITLAAFVAMAYLAVRRLNPSTTIPAPMSTLQEGHP